MENIKKHNSANCVSLPVTLAFNQIQSSSKIHSKIIGKWTKSNFSHVEIIIGDVWISSVEGKGVHVKKLEPLNDKYVYHKLKDAVLTESSYLDIKEWIYQQENSDYDITGILLSQIFPLRFDNRDKWFCSELVTKILQLLGYKEVFDLLPHLVDPGFLAKLYKLE